MCHLFPHFFTLLLLCVSERSVPVSVGIYEAEKKWRGHAKWIPDDLCWSFFFCSVCYYSGHPTDFVSWLIMKLFLGPIMFVSKKNINHVLPFLLGDSPLGIKAVSYLSSVLNSMPSSTCQCFVCLICAECLNM